MMVCPRCHAENREGRRFCGECGLSFASTCPSCGFLNEGTEKFCGGCGRSLTATARPVEPRFSSPQTYIPNHLAEKCNDWPFKLRRASIFVWMTNRVRRLRWRSIISLLTTALILTGCARGVLDVSFLAPTTNTDGSSLTDVAAYRVYYGTAAAPCPGERAIIAAAPKVPLSPDQPLEVRLTRLTIGQLYYVAVTAVNSRGIESACTNTESARARRP
jgi:Double zinc ribbon